MMVVAKEAVIREVKLAQREFGWSIEEALVHVAERYALPVETVQRILSEEI